MNQSDADAVLSLTGVHRVHGSGPGAVTALAGVDLTVAAGELVAVMGPSGSGKSTLLHVAGGLDRPDAGEVVVDGVPLSTLDPTHLAALRRRAVGYVFQDLNLLGSLTLLENVAVPLELDGMPRRRARAAAWAALERVDMTSQADRFPDDVSGGQRQRAALARAIVGHRRLLLADEPTGALDTASGDEVMGVLRQLVDAGSAAVVVTHDNRLAAWADRVIFLRDGLVVDSTPPMGREAPDWPTLRADLEDSEDIGDTEAWEQAR